MGKCGAGNPIGHLGRASLKSVNNTSPQATKWIFKDILKKVCFDSQGAVCFLNLLAHHQSRRKHLRRGNFHFTRKSEFHLSVVTRPQQIVEDSTQSKKHKHLFPVNSLRLFLISAKLLVSFTNFFFGSLVIKCRMVPLYMTEGRHLRAHQLQIRVAQTNQSGWIKVSR